MDRTIVRFFEDRLERADLDCIKLFRRNQKQIEEYEGSSVRQFAQHLENYDFEDALTLLRRCISNS